MTHKNPVYVLLYFIADVGAIAWLLHAFTGDLPHEMLSLSGTVGTATYAIIGLVGILSLGATLQHLS